MIFETSGNPSNPVIIMLNGSFSTGKGLIHIAEKLSDKYYVILPTYDGHHKDGGIFTTRQKQAEKIIEYLQKEKITRVALIQGASMGAEVAVTLSSLICKTDIKVDRYLLDGGPFFSFPKVLRKIMQMKFKGMVHQAQYGTKEEILERFSENKMVKWMVKGDIEPYRNMIEEIAECAPYMSDESVCNESDACYTFDFPEVPKEEQEKYFFIWSDNEPAYKSKKNAQKSYPHARYGVVRNLGHCGFMTRKPDKYALFMGNIAKGKDKR